MRIGDWSYDVCSSVLLAGMRVFVVGCDDSGNVDIDDLKAKVAQHGPQLAAIMITYPSTHGVFAEAVTEICDIVHQAGGQVYLDGAHLNAQVGLARPGQSGAEIGRESCTESGCPYVWFMVGGFTIH